jgi:hypothetical protein
MLDRGLYLTMQAIRRQLAAMPHDLYLVRLIHCQTRWIGALSTAGAAEDQRRISAPILTTASPELRLRLPAHHRLSVLIQMRIRASGPEAVENVVVVLRRGSEVSALADVLLYGFLV